MNRVEENRKAVMDGLQHRREMKEQAEKETRLEKYEQDMIWACNNHCAAAKINRRAEETGWMQKMQREANRAALERRRAEEAAREEAALQAVRYYGIACLAMVWLCGVSHLPIWAAVTMMASGAIFPVIRIYRIYNPIEER